MSLKEPFSYPIAKQSKTKNQPIKKVQNPQAKKKPPGRVTYNKKYYIGWQLDKAEDNMEGMEQLDSLDTNEHPSLD